jgi:hypothetical protein
MSRQKSETALRLVIGSTIVFGLMSEASCIVALEWPARFFTDFMVWPPDGAQTTQRPETRLAWALLGGFLTSWGVLQWQILTKVGRLHMGLARKLLLQSVCIWFVLDTAGSILGGVPVNGLVNVFFFGIYAVPLLYLRTEAAPVPARS